MKNPKKFTTILITAILVSLMTSLTFAESYTFNPNPNTGTTWLSPDASYSDVSKSAKAYASSYGDLLSPEYEWNDPWGNNAENTAFNPGPAPDRPDVLWRSSDTPSISAVIIDNNLVSVPGASIYSISGGVIGFSGQIFTGASISVNPANSTRRNALISFNPHTGAVNWAAIVGFGITSGTSVGNTLFKVDDTHLALRGGSFSMWTTEGKFLWSDNTINPGAVYRSTVVAPAPEYKVFGPRNAGLFVPLLGGWDLSNPDEDKGLGNRSIWNYTMDEPGNPMMGYGDGKIFMGSYSSYTVYAVNAASGEKIWETAMPQSPGYTGSYRDDRLFVGCQMRYEICLNGTTGEIIWMNDDGVENRAFNVYNIANGDGRVYYHDLGAGTTGATKCYDAATGEKLWASKTLFYIGYYTIAMGGGKIYGSQSDGSTTTGREPDPLKFACWDAYTGEMIWSIGMSITMPSVVYGCLYFIVGGELYCLSTAVEPEPWSMWRGNVENPGVTLDAGPRDISGGPKWTFTTGAGVISSPVIAKGKMYIGSNDKHLYCLDAYNGSLIWKFALENADQMTVYGSTPAVIGNKVITGPDDSNIYCLDANTGELLWKFNVGTYTPVQVSLGQFNVRSSPIIYNNKIYVGSHHNNRTYCIDLNGNQVWSFETGGPILSSVAIENDIVFQTTRGSNDPVWSDLDNVYMLNAANGARINNFTIETSGFARSGISFGSSFRTYAVKTPVVVDDILYYGVDNGYMHAYNVTTGTQIMSFEQPNVLGENSVGCSLFVPDNYGGKIYTQAGPTMACINASLRSDTDVRFDANDPSKTNIWSAWGGWEVWSSVIYSGFGYNAGAVVYSGSESGSMTVWNASNGTPLSWYTTGGVIPGSAAIWDGKLYFGSSDNLVYCFEDHVAQPMSMSISLDKSQMSYTESVTVTAKLSGTNTLNPYENKNFAPGLPNASVLVTFTKPDSVTEVTRTVTTDNMGWASVLFEPDVAGTWKVIAWYIGEDKSTSSYSYAFSDELFVNVAGPAPEPPQTLITSVTPATANIKIGESAVLTASTSGGTADFTYQWYQIISGNAAALSGETASTLVVAPTTEGTYGYYCEVSDAAGQIDSSDTAQVKVGTESTATGIPMEYIYAIIGIIAIAVIAIVAYMYLKKRK